MNSYFYVDSLYITLLGRDRKDKQDKNYSNYNDEPESVLLAR